MEGIMPERKKDQKGDTHPRGALGEEPASAPRRGVILHARPGVHSVSHVPTHGKARAIRAPLKSRKIPGYGE
jgi:hypothetical protein